MYTFMYMEVFCKQ